MLCGRGYWVALCLDESSPGIYMVVKTQDFLMSNLCVARFPGIVTLLIYVS